MIDEMQTAEFNSMANFDKASSPALSSLCLHLEKVVDNSRPLETAIAVKEALEHAVRTGGEIIPAQFLEPARDRYARRLIYMGEGRRFSLLAMVWNPGQGTPLHDHGGAWCVECIYRGSMRSTNYLFEGEREGIYQFRKKCMNFDVQGDASALVPPLDHHVLDNPGDSPSVTLHVYAEELTSCNAFLPRESGYFKKVCTLGYT
jgi:predicted metal-dependent enzyme (double-stranded beta helix superfamily)